MNRFLPAGQAQQPVVPFIPNVVAEHVELVDVEPPYKAIQSEPLSWQPERQLEYDPAVTVRVRLVTMRIASALERDRNCERFEPLGEGNALRSVEAE